jgi:hypothetical protein
MARYHRASAQFVPWESPLQHSAPAVHGGTVFERLTHSKYENEPRETEPGPSGLLSK